MNGALKKSINEKTMGFHSLIIEPELTRWCMNCLQFVGLEKTLQHIYPGKYPNGMKCNHCHPSHFFYYHHCPICHLPRIIPRELFDSFLPLKDDEIVDYCDSCQGLKKVKKKDLNDGHDAYLCEKCYEHPGWEENDDE